MSDLLESPHDLPACPICSGAMEVVFHRHGQMVAVCVDCHSGLTIPAAAREVGRLKHEKKWKPKEP